MWSTDYSAGQLLSRRKYNPQGSGTGRARAEDRLSTLLGPEETGDRTSVPAGPGERRGHLSGSLVFRLFFENCTVDASILKQFKYLEI